MMRVPVYFKSYTKHSLKDTSILLTNILTKPASNAIILFHSFVVSPPPRQTVIYMSLYIACKYHKENLLYMAPQRSRKV